MEGASNSDKLAIKPVSQSAVRDLRQKLPMHSYLLHHNPEISNHATQISNCKEGYVHKASAKWSQLVTDQVWQAATQQVVGQSIIEELQQYCMSITCEEVVTAVSNTFNILKCHVSAVPELLVCLLVTMLAMVLVRFQLAVSIIMILALTTMLLVMLVMVTSKRSSSTRHVRAVFFRHGLISVGHVRPWLPVSMLVPMLIVVLVSMLVTFAANLDAHESTGKAVAAAFVDTVLTCTQQ